MSNQITIETCQHFVIVGATQLARHGDKSMSVIVQMMLGIYHIEQQHLYRHPLVLQLFVIRNIF